MLENLLQKLGDNADMFFPDTEIITSYEEKKVYIRKNEYEVYFVIRQELDLDDDDNEIDNGDGKIYVKLTEIVAIKGYMTGTKIVENIELLCRYTSPLIEELILEDESEIKWQNFTIKLSYLYIMGKNISWYNSLGYFQKTYESDQMDLIILKEQNCVDALYNLSPLEFIIRWSDNFNVFLDFLNLNHLKNLFERLKQLQGYSNISDTSMIKIKAFFKEFITVALKFVSENWIDDKFNELTIGQIFSIIYFSIKNDNIKNKNQIDAIYIIYYLLYHLIKYNENRGFLIKRL